LIWLQGPALFVDGGERVGQRGDETIGMAVDPPAFGRE
jgi:hypothetical protein